MGGSKAVLCEILIDYKTMGIKHIATLWGDLPSGANLVNSELYLVNELVEFIRQGTGDNFTLELAAHPEMYPEATDFEDDLRTSNAK
jgi:methylenetetrahydrofolate reductase (NADPH)